MPRGVKRSEVQVLLDDIDAAQAKHDQFTKAARGEKQKISSLKAKIEETYARNIAKACRAAGIALEDVLKWVQEQQGKNNAAEKVTVDEKASAEKPAASDKPAAAAEKPAAKKPATRKPAAKKPAAKKTAKKPAAKKPAARKPATKAAKPKAAAAASAEPVAEATSPATPATPAEGGAE